ncbi:SET domain-containing protein-lysine N-methyltransferase [Oscillatoria salina]|uniref:SET domain-containing protein-lysine N-methyltransferase n=1 Tax=Oscillatoria salina TaxID=331517 RepID=UPI001CCCF9F0|nr:SET domain-containing protein-lysine N-methyltransferase [Oscillatoria salina]MBZ8181479.1 SET domain-containing protein [Oscillatoria salina IIICB1]
MIIVKKVQGKGRGIFTTQFIPPGTLLEVAPVSIIPAEQQAALRGTELFKYSFVQPVEYSQSKQVKGYLVFGLASLCNHEENPNSRVNWIEDEVGMWSYLIAQREIQPGEEVTLFYTNIDEYCDINCHQSNRE